MKYKVMAFLLALTMMSWAQSATTSQSAATEAKSGCACCEKMSSAENKDGKSCMRHKGAAKDNAECCSGKDSCCKEKDGKSCMKNDNMADRSAKGKCCEGKEMKCCSGKDEEKAQKCCEGMQCSRDLHHAS